MKNDPNDLMRLVDMSQLLAQVYRMPNGELLALGAPLGIEEDMRVAFFFVEHYAIANNMTVQEFVFNMMNSQDAENERLKKAKGIKLPKFKKH